MNVHTHNENGIGFDFFHRKCLGKKKNLKSISFFLIDKKIVRKIEKKTQIVPQVEKMEEKNNNLLPNPNSTFEKNMLQKMCFTFLFS